MDRLARMKELLNYLEGPGDIEPEFLEKVRTLIDRRLQNASESSMGRVSKSSPLATRSAR
jgi:hypothetical protein